MIALKSARDFGSLKTDGRRYSPTSWLTIQWKTNSNSQVRLGCTLPRYVGKAVTRNRIKRWCRNQVRDWARGRMENETVDLNLFFRRQPQDFYRELSHSDFQRKLARALEKVAVHHG